MNNQAILKALFNNNVLTEGENGIQWSENFRSLTDEKREKSKDVFDLRQEFPEAQWTDESATGLNTIASANDNFIAVLLALDQQLKELTFTSKLQVAILLEQFDRSIKSDGSPDSFLPIDGSHLDILPLFQYSIIYVWREDCEPCDILRSDLEDIFANGKHVDIATFSIYGPDNHAKLKEHFGPVAAPLVLFLVAGDVDSRLYGSHPKSAYVKEVGILKGIS